MTKTPPQIKAIGEIEGIAGPGTLTWHPVRRTLDVRAFGCNAYTAQEPGTDVVEPHTETKSGHDELYFVHSGHARFTIDGAVHEAPAGTYVHIPDPSSERAAVAVEAGTTVLTFGGPPSFQPSSWEWAFASTPLVSSDPERARELLTEGLQVHSDSPVLLYNLACVEAVEGHRDAAISTLRKAVEREPRAAGWAADDHDLEGLREDPEFIEITAPA
jgi:hypothetical protein